LITKNRKKFIAEIKFIFFYQNCNLLIPRPSLRTSKLQENFSSLKRKLEFSSLLWAILTLLDPDPYSQYGSGSTTLLRTVNNNAKKHHLLNFCFLLQLELLDVERFVELGNQILDVGNLLELLRAQCLQAGRDDLVAAVVDVQLKLLQEGVY
jgi:hypothetical protein